MGHLTKTEIRDLGLKSYGEDIIISDKCSIYSPQNIIIGSNVRIDDFTILSGTITIGSNIHISAYSAIYGKLGVELMDYSGLSPRCTILSATDDFSGEFMIGPMVDEKYTNVTGGKVIFEKFAQMGSGSIVMPNITIAEGSVIGANSFLKDNTNPWGIYAGCPATYIGERKKSILNIYEGFK